MSFTKLTTDVENISKLDNYPPDDSGMTPAKLKALFDQAGVDIKSYINNTLLSELEAGYIESIVKTSTSGLVDTYTVTYQDSSTYTFTVTNGAKGDTGATGKGISSIAKTSTSGLVDTYTITYTDSTTNTYTITNGAKGDTGNTGATGPQGATGAKGDTGATGTAATISVGTVTTGAAGSSATVTNSGTSSAAILNFSIPKGADGTGSGDMMAATYDPNGKATDAFALSNMADDATHRTVTDTEKSTWNAKQNTTGSLTAVTSIAFTDAFPAHQSSSNSEVKVSWATIRSALSTYFNGLYAASTHTHVKSDITDFPTSMTPTTHATTHKTGGSDVLLPSDIGAATRGANADITSLTGLTTPIPISEGGLGGSTAATSTYNLINSLSNISPETADRIPIKDVSGSTAGFSTISQILNLASAAKIFSTSYTGTGVFGSASQNVVAIGFVPQIVVLFKNYIDIIGFDKAGGHPIYASPDLQVLYNPISSLIACDTNSNTGYTQPTWAANFQWFNDYSALLQMNNSGTQYHLIAIG